MAMLNNQRVSYWRQPLWERSHDYWPYGVATTRSNDLPRKDMAGGGAKMVTKVIPGVLLPEI